MKRTTIRLPEPLRRRALFWARRKGVSLSELIRDSLDASLPASTDNTEKDPLFEDVVYDGPSPRNGAATHDKHLYDVEG
jgi:hypothetical protein